MPSSFAIVFLFLGGLIDEASAVNATYQTKYYSQTLDHVSGFSAADPRWSQRYLINDDFWKTRKLSDECPGPILMYTGNEADVTAFWSGNGFMIDYLAPLWGGLIVFPEQRYYGESIPSRSMKYLTTQNVLEDYIELLDFIKKDYDAELCPVVAFGGSYGATLTTFMRAAYPSHIIGGLASSAPTGYYDPENWASHGIDEFTFADIISDSYNNADPQCLTAISAVRDAIEMTAIDDLVTMFNLCDESGLGPHKSDLYLYGLEGLCQVNYPYQIGDTPAWPVNSACQTLVTAYNSCPKDSSRVACLVSAGASVTNMTLGIFSSSECFKTLEEGPGNIPGDGPGLTSWGYQSCTETLHEFSSRGIRDYVYEYNRSTSICVDLYGVLPNRNVLTSRYGGYNLGDGMTGITNIIWSNGLLDPWHGGGFKEEYAPLDAKERGMYFFLLEKGAHHFDLRGFHPDDPAEVIEVRKKEEEIIWGWIQEFLLRKK